MKEFTLNTEWYYEFLEKYRYLMEGNYKDTNIFRKHEFNMNDFHNFMQQNMNILSYNDLYSESKSFFMLRDKFYKMVEI